MILDENFAILDEDEDINDVEDAENEEVMDEGYIFNEAKIYKVITKANEIDDAESTKVVNRVKKRLDKKIASGKYRMFKSSDKGLLVKTLKDPGFLRSIFGNVPSLSNCRYSIFNYKGLVLVSVYYAHLKKADDLIDNETGEKKQPYHVYTMFIKNSNNKLIFWNVPLKAKVSDRTDNIKMNI